MGRFTGILGLLIMLGLAYLFSTNRRAIKLKTVLWGLGLQIALAFLVLRWTYGQGLIKTAGDVVNKVPAIHSWARSFCSVSWESRSLPSD